jgi:hypothetical protein
MSYFEEENYQKCGACHQNESAEKRAKAMADFKRKEEERKAREKREKDRKIAEQRSSIEDKLKKAVGKTISDVSVDEWTNAPGEEAKAVELLFTDGTSMEFAREEYADGCMGYYDYYYYLEIHYNDK